MWIAWLSLAVLGETPTGETGGSGCGWWVAYAPAPDVVHDVAERARVLLGVSLAVPDYLPVTAAEVDEPPYLTVTVRGEDGLPRAGHLVTADPFAAFPAVADPTSSRVWWQADDALAPGAYTLEAAVAAPPLTGRCTSYAWPVAPGAFTQTTRFDVVAARPPAATLALDLLLEERARDYAYGAECPSDTSCARCPGAETYCWYAPSGVYELSGTMTLGGLTAGWSGYYRGRVTGVGWTRPWGTPFVRTFELDGTYPLTFGIESMLWSPEVPLCVAVELYAFIDDGLVASGSGCVTGSQPPIWRCPADGCLAWEGGGDDAGEGPTVELAEGPAVELTEGPTVELTDAGLADPAPEGAGRGADDGCGLGAEPLGLLGAALAATMSQRAARVHRRRPDAPRAAGARAWTSSSSSSIA